MSRQLEGWDLATWRLTQSEPKLAANVVAIAEIAGIVDPKDLYPRIEILLATFPVLSMGITSTEPIEIKPLSDFNYHEYVSTGLNISSETIALANHEFSPDECLWRLKLIQKERRTYLVCALHHAIADGNTAMFMLQTLFDNPVIIPISKPNDSDASDIYEELKKNVGKIVGRITKDPVGLASDFNSLIQSLNRVVVLKGSTFQKSESSKLNTKFFKIDKRLLKNVTMGKGVSNHDVLVALLVGTLQRYSFVKKLSKSSLVANIPVAMDLSAASANKLVVARIDFDTQIQNLQELMQISRRKLRMWRNEPILSLASQLINASVLVPIEVIARATRSADLTISTLVAGSSSRRIFGLEIKGIWPLVPPIGAGLNFTSVGAGDYLYAGLALDLNEIADLDAWQMAFEETSQELFGSKIFEQIFE